MFRCSRFGAAVVLLILAVSKADAELAPDFLMEVDPEFRAPARVKRFNRDFKGLWLQALQQPEADLQRMTAETVARAHRHGIPDLIELVPPLETILTAAKSHPSARFAAAHALIVLESRQSAAKLFQVGSSEGSDLRGLIEPALAVWDFVPIRETWIQRLQTPETRITDLVLAIQGLGQVRDVGGLPFLQKIVMDPLAPSSVRLEAAATAGSITDTGLEADAAQLCERQSSASLIERLCAVRLLNRHTSPGARQLLIKLASDPEAAVAKSAMTCLNRIDSDLVVPLAEIAMQHADSQIRREGAVAYLDRPTEDRIRRLAQMLDDPHPTVRKHVAEGMCQLAEKPEFDEVIR